MVPRPLSRSTTIKERALFLILFFILITTFTIAIFYLIDYFRAQSVVEIPPEPEEIIEPEEPEELPEEILEIDFTPIVENWVDSVAGNKSIIIYDTKLDKVVGSYNTEEIYNTASLYKLFVVYEGYRRLQNGVWQSDEIAGSTGRTILECLDLAIRESYSPCAETLWAIIGHDELDEIIENEFGILNSRISGLSSNANDILAMMKIFYHHTEIEDPVLLETMRDSFLNQPATTYNWRQGLPSGFKKAEVYNKVGWAYNPNINNWDIYHDAAIVKFPEYGRDYIVVVMTNYIPFARIRDFGTDFEDYFYKNIESLKSTEVL